MALATAGLVLGVAAGAAWRYFDAGRGGTRSTSSRSGAPGAPGYRTGIASGADVLLITIDTLRADALGFAGNR